MRPLWQLNICYERMNEFCRTTLSYIWCALQKLCSSLCSSLLFPSSVLVHSTLLVTLSLRIFNSVSAVSLCFERSNRIFPLNLTHSSSLHSGSASTVSALKKNLLNQVLFTASDYRCPRVLKSQWADNKNTEQGHAYYFITRYELFKVWKWLQ